MVDHGLAAMGFLPWGCVFRPGDVRTAGHLPGEATEGTIVTQTWARRKIHGTVRAGVSHLKHVAHEPECVWKRFWNGRNRS